MKYVFVTILSLLSLDAFAGGCVDKLIVTEDQIIGENGYGDRASPAAVQCVLNHPEFALSLNLFCTKNKKDLSAEYKEYLKYKKVVDELKNRLAATTYETEKFGLFLDIQHAETELTIFGHVNELSEGHMNLYRSQSDCREK